MQTIVVSCIIFRKKLKTYEFLLLKRTPQKGSFWQPPGGVYEKKDKSKLEGVYREVFEETGIKKEDFIRVLENIHQFTFDKHHITNEPINPIKEFVHAFQVKKNVKININKNKSKEHENYKWVSFEQALKMLKWQNNIDSFNKLRKTIF
ncbi:MAG: NUDIX domain-containing protein [Nanoarchaeota archaeon]|nr:NUDIX domain-containing protein [Nanoarchaeota archaeon]MBU1855316.1 NUDIX domain-containing protein [Nanoarchaeota archaeon]